MEKALSSLEKLDGLGEAAALEPFLMAAETLLAASSRSEGSLEQTGVHLLSLTAARHTRFRVVFLPGLAERSFPQAGQQDPILLDEERYALSANGFSLPLKSARPQEEQFLFLLALEAARERLILTVPRATAASGAERIASCFLLAALECLEGRPVSGSDLDGSGSTGLSSELPPPARAPELAPLAQVTYIRRSGLLSQTERTALDRREFDLGRIKTLLESERPETSRYPEHLSPDFARALAAEQTQWGTELLTAYDGLLSTPEHRAALARLFPEDRVYSATALERYASCPYRFFLQDVLRLQELDDPASADFIPARDKGVLMHDILKDFYGRLKTAGELPLSAANFPAYRVLLANVCQEYFQRAEDDGLTGLAATWELDRQSILSDLERHLRAEIEDGGGWIPEAFERSFGRPGGDPPVDVPIGGDGRIRLNGQIDRIDRDATGKAVRIIDYKSGKRKNKLKVDLHGGQALQLPVYLLAAAHLYPGIDLRQSSAQYCHITRAGDWSRCEFQGASLLNGQRDLQEIFATILNGCRNGIFPRCPEGNANACVYCAFRRVGDPRRDILWQRKRSDPRLEAFLQMRSKA